MTSVSHPRLFPFGGMLALALLLAAPVAQAEPQLLALVATEAAQPLHCTEDGCRAQLSVFCLQQNRASPEPGTPYRLADPASVTLQAAGPDGRPQALDARALRFRALRTHVAVEVTVDPARLPQAGRPALSLRISDSAVLLPAGTASEAPETAMAVGPLRQAGGALIDRGSTDMAAARLVLRLVNRVQRDPAGTPMLRQAAAADPAFRQASPAVQRRTEAALERCQRAKRSGIAPDLGRCLEQHHDSLLGALNKNYWEAVKTGS